MVYKVVFKILHPLNNPSIVDLARMVLTNVNLYGHITKYSVTEPLFTTQPTNKNGKFQWNTS